MIKKIVTYTEAEAREKECRQAFLKLPGDCIKFPECSGSKCMFWVWDSYSSEQRINPKGYCGLIS